MDPFGVSADTTGSSSLFQSAQHGNTNQVVGDFTFSKFLPPPAVSTPSVFNPPTKPCESEKNFSFKPTPSTPAATQKLGAALMSFTPGIFRPMSSSSRVSPAFSFSSSSSNVFQDAGNINTFSSPNSSLLFPKSPFAANNDKPDAVSSTTLNYPEKSKKFVIPCDSAKEQKVNIQSPFSFKSKNPFTTISQRTPFAVATKHSAKLESQGDRHFICQKKSPVKTASLGNTNLKDATKKKPLNESVSEHIKLLPTNDLTSIVSSSVPDEMRDVNTFKNYFSQFGEVVKVRCKKAHKCMVIEFANHESAAQAKEKANMVTPDNKPVNFFWCSSKPRSKGTKRQSEVDDELNSMLELDHEHNVLPRPQKLELTDVEEPILKYHKKKMVPGSRQEKKTIAPKHIRGTKRQSEVDDELDSMLELGRDHNVLSRPRELKATDVEHISKGHKKKMFSGLKQEKKTIVSKYVKDETRGSLIQKEILMAEERSRLLDNVDKLLRQSMLKQSDISIAQAPCGTCVDMCPEKERYIRYATKSLSSFEQVLRDKFSTKLEHKLIIKEYSRSSADQEEPLPHELRPSKTLMKTMDYLVCNIIDKQQDKRFGVGEWYDFIWNRTRAIRKDLTQQHLCDYLCVEVIEKCTRFHIYCAAALCEEDISVFDVKINNENLNKCLKTLKYLYADLKEKHVDCPNEPEFRAYDILLSLNEGDTLRHVQQHRAEIRDSPEVYYAVNVALAYTSNNFVKFFKLVNNATYLNACILHRYIAEVRLHAIQVILKAYCIPNRIENYPVENLCRILKFDDVKETVEFCKSIGLKTNEKCVLLERILFPIAAASLPPSKYLNLVEAKKKCSLAEVINKGPLPPNPLHSYTPSSSFDSKGCFKENLQLIATEKGKKDSTPSFSVKKDSTSSIKKDFIASTTSESSLALSVSSSISSSSSLMDKGTPSFTLIGSQPVQNFSFTRDKLKDITRTIAVTASNIVQPSSSTFTFSQGNTPSINTDLLLRPQKFHLQRLFAKPVVPNETATVVPNETATTVVPKETANVPSVKPAIDTAMDNAVQKVQNVQQLIVSKASQVTPCTLSQSSSTAANIPVPFTVPKLPPKHITAGFSKVICKDIFTEILEDVLQPVIRTLCCDVIAVEHSLNEQRRKLIANFRKQYAKTTVKLIINEVIQSELETLIRSTIKTVKVQQLNRVSSILCNEIIEDGISCNVLSVAKEVYDVENRKWLSRLEAFKQQLKLRRAKRYLTKWWEITKKRKQSRAKVLLGCPILQVKLPSSEIAPENPVVASSQYKVASRLLEAGVLYTKLKEEISWMPYNLSDVIENNFKRGIRFPKVSPKTSFWKLLVVYFDDGEMTDPSMALFSNWLCTKFVKGTPKHELDNATTLCSLYWLAGQDGNRIAICVRSVCIGSDFEDAMEKLQHSSVTKGTTAVLLCLPSTMDNQAKQSHCSRFQQFLQKLFLKPTIPTFCLFTSASSTQSQKSSRAPCQQAEDYFGQLKKMELVSNYKLLTLDLEDDYSVFSQKVFHSVEWLIKNCPTFPDIKSQYLQDYVYDGITEIFTIIYEDIAHKKNKDITRVEPEGIVNIFNKAMTHRASVAFSSVETMSWPMPEIEVESGLLNSDWTIQEKKNAIKDVVYAVMLPKFSVNASSVQSVFSYIKKVIIGPIKESADLFYRTHNLIQKAKASQMDNAYFEIPWVDIMYHCAQYVASHQIYCDKVSGKEYQVVYLGEKLEKLQMKDEWQRMDSRYNNSRFTSSKQRSSMFPKVIIIDNMSLLSTQPPRGNSTNYNLQRKPGMKRKSMPEIKVIEIKETNQQHENGEFLKHDPQKVLTDLSMQKGDPAYVSGHEYDTVHYLALKPKTKRRSLPEDDELREMSLLPKRYKSLSDALDCERKQSDAFLSMLQKNCTPQALLSDSFLHEKSDDSTYDSDCKLYSAKGKSSDDALPHHYSDMFQQLEYLKKSIQSTADEERCYEARLNSLLL